MLLALGWAGWYFYQILGRASAEQRVAKAIAASSPGTLPGEIKDQILLARQEFERHGGPVLAMLLAERLALAAWYFPDESQPMLAESIRLNRQVFGTEAGGLAFIDASSQMDYVGYTLAWAYFTAGLFEEFSGWKDEMSARAPGFREGLLALEASALLMRDDLLAVTALAEHEARTRASSVHTPGIAAAAYVSAGQLDKAITFAEQARVTEGSDPNIELALAACAIAQEDFHTASQILRDTVSKHGPDPDIEQELLTAVIGVQGPGGPEADRLAKRAAASTRMPRTADGARALSLGRLYFLTLNPAWLELLEQTAAANADDFAVQAALAQALLDADDALAYPQARAGRKWRGPNAVPGIGQTASMASQLAQTDTQTKWVNVLQARAQAHAAAADAAQLDDAVDTLRGALGLQGAAGGAPAGAITPYDGFLLDYHVRSLRSRNQTFDEAVHAAVSGYLDLRRSAFREVLLIPLGSFGQKSRQAPRQPAAKEVQSSLPKHTLTGVVVAYRLICNGGWGETQAAGAAARIGFGDCLGGSRLFCRACGGCRDRAPQT